MANRKFFGEKKDFGIFPAYEEDQKVFNKIKRGDIVEMSFRVVRNVKFHNKYFSMLRLVFNNLPEDFEIKINDKVIKVKNVDHLLYLIKIEIGLYHLVVGIDGKVDRVVKSISFEKMSEPDFESFFEDSLDCVIRVFLPGADRDEMLEMISTFL